jgi:1-phosphofructokinase family hexose kinase
MILTVTLNTALDKVLFIDEWKSGPPMRTEKVVTSVGGKGLDSSVVLRHLGVETVGICFVAGKVGQELVDLCVDYGIQPDPVWVGGETRIAHVIVEQRHHRHNHIIAGSLSISPADCEELLHRFAQRAPQANYVICAGSIPSGLPADFYNRMTEIAHQSGVPLLIDSQGSGITGALPAHPDVLKMNWDEFESTFGKKAPTRGDLIAEAYDTFKEYNMKTLVITCARDGILAFTPQGAFWVTPPPQQAINAAGAGDAVSSAMAWRLTLGDDWREALRWGAATSAAVVLTEGTADCRMEDVLRLLEAVEVEDLNLTPE